MKEVKEVETTEDYKLLLDFGEGEKRAYDMSGMLDGVFESLNDYNNFKSVKVIDGVPTWILNHTEIDICPDSVYIDSRPVGDAV